MVDARSPTKCTTTQEFKHDNKEEQMIRVQNRSSILVGGCLCGVYIWSMCWMLFISYLDDENSKEYTEIK